MKSDDLIWNTTTDYRMKQKVRPQMESQLVFGEKKAKSIFTSNVH
jgi:hypothetical protein